MIELELSVGIPVTVNENQQLSARPLADALFRTGHGDRLAFSELYALTSAKLFGICLRVCGDRQVAEDALRETYLAAWNRAGAWDPEHDSPIVWLATIARNHAIDARRAQEMPRAAPTEEASPNKDSAADIDATLMIADGDQHIHPCLAALDPQQRDAIQASFFSGATYASLANSRGVSSETMKSWIQRALAQMSSRIQRHSEHT